MTDTKAAQPEANETLPLPLDDVEPIEPAPITAERSEQAEEAGPRVMPVETQPFADARERIAQLYRDQRERDEADDAQARAELDAARQVQEAADASAQHQQQHVKIVVDGREQVLPLNEVIRRAQINSAADNRLEEAKRLLKQARAERNGEDYPEFEDTPEQPRTPTSGNRNERLREIVEKIQVGDSDEGAQALEELVDVQAQAITQRVQQQAFLAANESAMKVALDRFIQKYPDAARDPDLGTTGVNVLTRVLKDEVRRVPGVSEEQLAAVPNDLNGARVLAHSVAALRQQGHKLRDFGQVMDRVGDEMTRKFGLRAGSVVHGDRRIGTQAEINARYERKRAMAQQPRPAGIRMAPQQEYARPKTAQEIVAEQRRFRGFDR